MKTNELIGMQLDWAVARAEGLLDKQGANTLPAVTLADGRVMITMKDSPYCPSSDWAQCGPIIEQEKIEWQYLPAVDPSHRYGARKPSHGGILPTYCVDGPTILVAAMRCYVASKLGDEVSIPAGLINGA